MMKVEGISSTNKDTKHPILPLLHPQPFSAFKVDFKVGPNRCIVADIRCVRSFTWSTKCRCKPRTKTFKNILA